MGVTLRRGGAASAAGPSAAAADDEAASSGREGADGPARPSRQAAPGSCGHQVDGPGRTSGIREDHTPRSVARAAGTAAADRMADSRRRRQRPGRPLVLRDRRARRSVPGARGPGHPRTRRRGDHRGRRPAGADQRTRGFRPCSPRPRRLPRAHERTGPRLARLVHRPRSLHVPARHCHAERARAVAGGVARPRRAARAPRSGARVRRHRGSSAPERLTRARARTRAGRSAR